MAMVAARQAMYDPRVQQLGVQIAGELGNYVSEALSKRARKRRNRNSRKRNSGGDNNMQLVRYNPNQGMVRAPVAYNTRVRNRKPRMLGNAVGGITISHREYVGEVVGSTTFAVGSYQIQPGISQTFPWLSGIANNFEKYRVVRMTLEYVNVSATSERGRVTLAYDADPLDNDPRDKVELFSYKGAVEGSVWSPLKLEVPCSNTKYFTRNGVVTGTDLKTYDAGKLVVGASNTNDASTVGELFISYEIELTIPQPVTCPSTQIIGGGTISKTNPFGDAPVVTHGSLPVSVLNNTITFLTPGYYMVALYAAGTSPGAVSMGGTVTAGDNDSVTDNGGGETMTVIEVWAKLAGQTLTGSYSGTSITSTKLKVTKTSGMTV